MATSQNGYSANDRSVIASYTVPGTSLRVALRKGDCSVVLLEYLRRYHLEVESLVHNPQDLWGYAERTIRGSNLTLSNHASGTAVDTRATRHGLGMTGTFTKNEEAALDDLLDDFDGVLRHGKDFSGRKDPMHAELVGVPARVRAVADRIRASGSLTIARPSLPEDDMTPEQASQLLDVWNQLTGNGYQGWSTWDGGTDESLTLVDYARRDNVETRQLHHNLTSVHQKLDALLGARLAAVAGEEAPAAPPSLSDIPTPELFAELARRMQGEK